MKPPPRTLKRKRVFGQDDDDNEEEETTRMVVKSQESPKFRHDTQGQSSTNVTEKGSIPTRDTTSNISGVTSRDEVPLAMSVTSPKGDDSMGKRESMTCLDPPPSTTAVSSGANENPSLVGHDGPSEAITAYRNATEILVEIANRDDYRLNSHIHTGFGGPPGYGLLYTQGQMGHFPMQFPDSANQLNTNPYSNHQQMSYVTPYTNSPVSNEPAQSYQSNRIEYNAPSAIRSGSLENRAASGSNPEASREIDQNLPESKRTSNDGKDASTPLGFVDGFLALANGGVLPGREEAPSTTRQDREQTAQNKPPTFAPPSPGETIDEAMARADDDVQALVNRIAEDFMTAQETPHLPPIGIPITASYSSMNRKQLGTELKRLVSKAQPEVNEIMPSAHAEAANQFYAQMTKCINIQNEIKMKPPATHSAYFQPPPTSQWTPARFPPPPPPPPPPPGYMFSPTQWANSWTPPQLLPRPISQTETPTVPSNASLPRGTFIAPAAVENPEQVQAEAKPRFAKKTRDEQKSGGALFARRKSKK
ncbi:hypothetical protein ACLMJK_005967 [Lecanora helva]